MDFAVTVVNIHEAKTHLSRLLERAASGEEIVIAKAGKPVARLVAVYPQPPRPLGFVKGRLTDAFFEPLPDDELEAWGQ
jgi:prevent-host-death family protein